MKTDFAGIKMIPDEEIKNLKDKNIIDISAGTGKSTMFLKNFCRSIIATEARIEKFLPKDIEIFQLDVEDTETLKNVIKNKDVLFSYGLFYHLQSHWQVLKTLCYSNLKYFFIETLCGPESSNPEMWWGREESSSNLNAYSNTEKNLMHGSPNLIWIHQTVNCFGASIQMVVREYQAWRENEEPSCRWRMLIKIVPNTKKSIDISNIWKNVEGTWTV